MVDTLRYLAVLLGAALVTVLGFLAVILGGAAGVGVHELAGTLLLVLLLPALALAYLLRSTEPRLLVRVGIALVALVIAGAIGGALATGSAPDAFDGLPLVPLAFVVVAVADGLRILVGTPGFRSAS